MNSGVISISHNHSMKIQDTTRSDELTGFGFRAMFSEGGLFGQFGHLVQIKLILDANSVLADLRWLVCKAKNSLARTSLLESIDSETIIPFAPTYLNIEVQKNIPLIAREEGVEPSLLFEKWELFRPKITFVDVGGPVEGALSH